MNVVAFNGSPHENGNTAFALNLVLDELKKEGIETEMLQVGKEQLHGCTACNGCLKKQDGTCVVNDGPINEWIAKMIKADGILFGSPVHFSGVGGAMKSFMDRAFYVAGVNGGLFRHKVGASVAAVRRSGGIPTVDAMDKFISYSEMIMPSSNYWNVAHGLKSGDMDQDAEGKQIMEVLGRNMAWIMKLIEHGKEQIPAPARVEKTWTHFVR
ncbi:MAG: flavodoxin family protein [Kiritimatiellaceae bacterium]|nr:flavodoxin family protein [Kiritimatiellaceae bacterium]